MLKALGTLDSVHEDYFREEVWKKKYKADSDKHIRDTIDRLCSALGLSEAHYHLMFNGKFLPGGRVLYSIGNDSKYRLTPMNCFVLPIKEDSLEGIFLCAYEMAKTYSYGGGVGVDISTLRPKGSPVSNAARTSTGAVSFTHLFDTVTGVIGQHGRRGALLLCMHIAHPDIFDFITCKTDLKVNLNMNISVKVPDRFMEAVDNDEEWDLWFPVRVEDEIDKTRDCVKQITYLSEAFDFPEYEYFWDGHFFYRKRVLRTVKARELWDLICETALKTAEPGVLFWDRICEDYTLEEPRLLSTNPCGELPLPAYGACNLGSVNLVKFVDPETGEVKWEELKEAVKLGIRFLDRVLDYSVEKEMYPLPEQTEAVRTLGKIGLGITGLADALILARKGYGSKESLDWVRQVMEKIERTAYATSIEIAKEKGAVLKPPYRGHILKAQERYPDLDWEAGLAHSSLLSVAPTGTISQILGCSTGCEPLFATHYHRLVKWGDKEELVEVRHWLLDDLEELGLDLSEYIVTAKEIDYIGRVQMQALLQEYVDSSISSTVNLPANTTKEDINQVYWLAWGEGCKGITVYVEGSREGVIREVEEESKGGKKGGLIIERNDLEVVEGKTVRIPTDPPCYLTLNFHDGDPIEVFFTVSKAGSDEKANSEAIGRLISLCLQSGVPIQKVIKTLSGIKGENTQMRNGWIVHSLPDAVAKGLLRLLGEDKVEYNVCPSCGAKTYVNVNGCGYCQSCGFSRCE